MLFTCCARMEAIPSAYLRRDQPAHGINQPHGISQPHGPNASAILGDMRGVRVSNFHPQSSCAAKSTGSVYTYKSVLYNLP